MPTSAVVLRRVTLPETNIAPPNRPSQKEMSFSNDPFSGAMLVSGRVNSSLFKSFDEIENVESDHMSPVVIIS